MRKLTSLQAEIIAARVRDPRGSYADIGKRLSVSRQRVHQQIGPAAIWLWSQEQLLLRHLQLIRSLLVALLRGKEGDDGE